VRGYTATSYGEAFADVYDEWYADLDDPLAWRDLVVASRPQDGPQGILELGVGTGRLAVPIAAAGHHVVGVDVSAAMIARIPPDADPHYLQTVVGDMVDDLPDGPFGVAFCGFNTFFNLLSEDRQRACLAAVSKRLAAGGALLIETSVAVPLAADHDEGPDNAIELRSMTTEQVVLSVSRANPTDQLAEGQFIHFTNGSVQLRPWMIRWCTPTQLDQMAGDAGLRLEQRFADVHRNPFTEMSSRQLSIYRRDQPSNSGPIKTSTTETS